jgi:flagellar basal-body rod protein FlgG
VLTPDGTVLGRLSVVTVRATDGLQAVGDNLFVPGDASGRTVAATGYRVRQGELEGSNVDLGEAFVQMIEAQRSYSLASKAISTQDELMQIANRVKS